MMRVFTEDGVYCGYSNDNDDGVIIIDPYYDTLSLHPSQYLSTYTFE